MPAFSNAGLMDSFDGGQPLISMSSSMFGSSLLALIMHCPTRMVFFMPGVGFISLPVSTSTSPNGVPSHAIFNPMSNIPLISEQYVHMVSSYLRYLTPFIPILQNGRGKSPASLYGNSHS